MIIQKLTKSKLFHFLLRNIINIEEKILSLNYEDINKRYHALYNISTISLVTY